MERLISPVSEAQVSIWLLSHRLIFLIIEIYMFLDTEWRFSTRTMAVTFILLTQIPDRTLQERQIFNFQGGK